MKFNLSLLLAVGISANAAAADVAGQFHLDVAAGGASHGGDGAGAATQIALSWAFRPGVSLEIWQGRGESDRSSAAPDPQRLNVNVAWIDRLQGAGLRYEWGRDADSRWHPFVRAGWARVHGSGQSVVARNITTVSSGVALTELVYSVQGFKVRDDAPYVALGVGYQLDPNWRLTGQLQYLPNPVYRLVEARTELLIGVGYTF